MDQSGRKTAYMNVALVLTNIVVYFILEFIGNTESGEFMLNHGAVFLPNVVFGHEYYRLLTAVFLHFGIDHLVNNMVVLFVLGDTLERAMGHVKYLLFYLLCGIGANVCSLLWDMHIGIDDIAVSAGASGAIFGVTGGLFYAVVVNKGQLAGLNTRQMVVMVVLSLYLGFTNSGVNNVAHVSGLILGVMLAMILYRKPKRREEVQW